MPVGSICNDPSEMMGFGPGSAMNWWRAVGFWMCFEARMYRISG